MKVTNLPGSEQGLYAVNHPVTSGHQSKRIIPGGKPKGQFSFFAILIIQVKRMIYHGLILCRLKKQINFLRAEALAYA
jgi:hypothetical protein